MIFYLNSDQRIIIYGKKHQSCYSSLLDSGILTQFRIVTSDSVKLPFKLTNKNCMDYVVQDKQLVLNPVPPDPVLTLLRVRCIALRKLEHMITRVRRPLSKTILFQNSVYAMKTIEATKFLEKAEGSFLLLKGAASAHGSSIEQEALKILSSSAMLENVLINSENARIILQAMIIKAESLHDLKVILSIITPGGIKNFNISKPPILSATLVNEAIDLGAELDDDDSEDGDA